MESWPVNIWQAKASVHNMSKFFKGKLFDQKESRTVQDPLSFRNATFIHGAVYDTLAFLEKTLMAELDASDDNPIVDRKTKRILSTPNFETIHLSLATEMVNVSLSTHLSRTSVQRMLKLSNLTLPIYRDFYGLMTGNILVCRPCKRLLRPWMLRFIMPAIHSQMFPTLWQVIWKIGRPICLWLSSIRIRLFDGSTNCWRLKFSMLVRPCPYAFQIRDPWVIWQRSYHTVSIKSMGFYRTIISSIPSLIVYPNVCVKREWMIYFKKRKIWQ